MRPRFNLPGLLFLVGLALLWQLLAGLAHSPNFPTFFAVVATLGTARGPLARALGHTLARAGTGFSIALVTMVPLGVVIGRLRPLREIVGPVIEFVRPLPPIAIVPVTMIFLGVGDTAKIAVVIYGAAFPILINTIDAVHAIDPMLSNIARTLRLTRTERMRLIDLPAALPRIVAGVRISISLSLLLAVVAEMLLSTDGLGAFIVRAQESFEIDKVLAGLLVIAFVAITINFTALEIERRLLAWHHARNVEGSALGQA